VNEFTLIVQVVEGEEEMLQTTLKESSREPPDWVSQKQVLPAIPHGPLHEALMIPIGVVNGEHIQGSSHMPMSRMGRIHLADSLIGLKLVSTRLSLIPCEDLQSDIIVLPTMLSFSIE
jgi:hypothetical protein